MRWLWRAVRWLVGLVVFVFLMLAIALALLTLFNIQDARHALCLFVERAISINKL